MTQRCSLILLIAATCCLLLIGNCGAFSIQPSVSSSRRFVASLLQSSSSSSQLPGDNHNNNNNNNNNNNEVDIMNAAIAGGSFFSRHVATMTTAFATTTAYMTVFPVWAETDDYEYGAVNAPIGIAWAAGVLAILTALLPLALRGGEEAFEEIRERDKESFGKSPSDNNKGKK